MEQKPGMTRLAFIIICACIALLGSAIVLFMVRTPSATDIKDIANMAIGALVGILGTTVAFYFGGKVG